MTEINGHQIGILDNLLEYWQPPQHIHLKKKKRNLNLLKIEDQSLF